MRSHSSAVPDSANPDVVLVGGGIMSATLAALIGVVAPQWSVTVFESAADVAGESSQAWNNAGTGHSALCELNYTPAGPDGRVDPSKAVTINEQFQVSRQFWSHLVREGLTGAPKEFITQALERHGLRPLRLADEHIWAKGKLPLIHGDPFDRLLIAQAHHEGMMIVTPDCRIQAYPVRTHW